MEATSSRNELVRILSDVYRAASSDELEPITYLIQGRLVPFFEPVEIGLGQGLLMAAIASAYGAPKEKVVKLNRATRDLRVTAQRLGPTLHGKRPMLVNVDQRLSPIVVPGGAGCRAKRL